MFTINYFQVWLEYKTDQTLLHDVIYAPAKLTTYQVSRPKLHPTELVKLCSLIYWGNQPRINKKFHRYRGLQLSWNDKPRYLSKPSINQGVWQFNRWPTKLYKKLPKYDYQNFQQTFQSFTYYKYRWSYLYAFTT